MTTRRHLGVLVLLGLLPGCASMRDLYRTEVRTERSAHPPDTQQLLTEDQVTALPEPVRRYLRTETGPEMDRSALLTILAEALLVPGYAIQPYITWTPMDDRSAAATIRHGAVEASGVFHFDEAGDVVRFESEDRYQSSGEDGRCRGAWMSSATRTRTVCASRTVSAPPGMKTRATSSTSAGALRPSGSTSMSEPSGVALERGRRQYRDVLGFLLFSHAWTWAFWALAGLSSESVWDVPGVILFVMGGAGVFLGGVVMNRIAYGAAGLRDLGRRIVDPRPVSAGWWLVILLLFPALVVASAGAASVLGLTAAPLDLAGSAQQLADPRGLLVMVVFILVPQPRPGCPCCRSSWSPSPGPGPCGGARWRPASRSIRTRSSYCTCLACSGPWSVPGGWSAVATVRTVASSGGASGTRAGSPPPGGSP
jgi:hypothetical protein